jgi:arylsulfatase A-like enzyme
VTGAGRSLLPLALVLASCADREVESGTWRWIDELPVRAFSVAGLDRVECVERYEFRGGVLPDAIQLAEGAIVPRPGAGVSLRGGALPPRLALARSFSGDEARAVRLVVSGLRTGGVRVLWSAPDGERKGEVRIERAAGSGARRDQFVADLAGAARTAREFRLEVEPTTAAGEIVTLSELCVGTIRPVGIRLPEAAHAPWKVTVEGDTRDALLVPPAGRLRRSARVPRRARLELGVAQLAGEPTPIRILATLRAGGGEERQILDRRLGAAELASGWIELEADLPPAARGAAELGLAAVPDHPGPDLVVALAAPRLRAIDEQPAMPNIVLVSIDTLRADHLSLYGYPRPTSPGLDAWARRHAATFRRTVAPSSWTLPSHFSLFTGLDGFAHPANYSSIAIDAAAYGLLAEELWHAGYTTRAWTGGAYLAPDYGFARGFERFRWWLRKEERELELATHLADVHRFLERAPEEPFFLFLHTYEVHTPNLPREPWFSRFHGRPEERIVDLGVPDRPRPEDGFVGSGHFVARRRGDPERVRLGGGDLRLVRDSYDSNVAYADSLLSPLLERLVRPPFAGRTAIAVVSDHGESLGEEGRAGHHYLTLDNLLVPLVLALPDGTGAGLAIESQVRLHDLHPTLLELAGLEARSRGGARSLLPLAGGAREPGRTAFSYEALTNHGLSLITADGATQLEWRNHPWRTSVPTLDWYRIAGFAEHRLAGAPSAEERTRWERILRDAYASAAPGLRLELAASGEEAVDFELVTELVDPSSVKAVDLDGERLDWSDVGRLAGRVAPGRPLRLQFERFARREVALALSARFVGCAEAARLEVVSSAAELVRAREWRLAGDACSSGSAPAPLRFRLEWRGPVPTSTLQPSDRRLEDDLRALGYLN